ncbi:MAG: hypothetical protein JWN07_3563 [Hyphomicrobiales bacterium]|nr:hypothetical protein [Hyphomicrobiales bacterium]
MRLFAQDLTSDDLHHLAVRGLSEAGGPKPLLLRVLTDLFVMRPMHSREESRQFAEIAHRLMIDATPAECDHTADVLCHHPAAPPDLLDRLAQRGGEGALKLFAKCRALSTPLLQDAAGTGNGAVAEAIARRADLDPTMIATLAARSEIEVLRTLARNESAPLAPAILPRLVARARTDLLLAQALAERLPHRVETLALFMTADARQRALMIARTRESAGELDPVSSALEHGADTALRRIEAIALEGATDDFAAALADACHCDVALARAIMMDGGGEPLAIALRALGLRPEIVTRIFLLVDPQTSHARGRASALARLASGLSQDVAKRILDAITGRVVTPPRHAPLHDQTARLSSARAGLTPSRAPRSVRDLLKRPA